MPGILKIKRFHVFKYLYVSILYVIKILYDMILHLIKNYEPCNLTHKQEFS